MTIHHTTPTAGSPAGPQHQPHYLGHEVVDEHDQVVGTVTDVLYDDATNEPRWFVVDPGAFRAERYVPIDGSYTAENGHVVIPYDKKWVKEAPHAAHDHVLTASDELALDQHYETSSATHHGSPAAPSAGPAPVVEGIVDRSDDGATRTVATRTDRDAAAVAPAMSGSSLARRYLVLVDAPVRAETIKPRLAEFAMADAHFHVVVPARELTDDEREFVAHERDAGSASESTEMLAARWRLQAAIDALVEAGFTDVTGSVGSASPVEAIDEALTDDHFHSVIVVTRPTGIAGWVHLDLPSRVARHVDEPVVHIEI